MHLTLHTRLVNPPFQFSDSPFSGTCWSVCYQVWLQIQRQAQVPPPTPHSFLLRFGGCVHSILIRLVFPKISQKFTKKATILLSTSFQKGGLGRLGYKNQILTATPTKWKSLIQSPVHHSIAKTFSWNVPPILRSNCFYCETYEAVQHRRQTERVETQWFFAQYSAEKGRPTNTDCKTILAHPWVSLMYGAKA